LALSDLALSDLALSGLALSESAVCWVAWARADEIDTGVNSTSAATADAASNVILQKGR
jgi:hypothetical protein